MQLGIIRAGSSAHECIRIHPCSGVLCAGLCLAYDAEHVPLIFANEGAHEVYFFQKIITSAHSNPNTITLLSFP